MAANWAIREEDIVAKRGRVEASLPRIAELNGYVDVSAHTASLSAESLAKYNVSVYLRQISVPKSVSAASEGSRLSLEEFGLFCPCLGGLVDECCRL
jgi:hypothetical protein